MRPVLFLFVFAAVIAAGLSRDLDKSTDRPQASNVVATSHANQPPSRQTGSGRTVTLQSDGRGHFQVDARIDGRRIDALVDTGASMVVLNESSAAKLGIFPRPSEYTGKANTANGVAKFAPVTLNRVEVNGITVRDIRAAVMPDEALKVNLLGMSFLSKVKFSHDRGRLILEQ